MHPGCGMGLLNYPIPIRFTKIQFRIPKLCCIVVAEFNSAHSTLATKSGFGLTKATLPDLPSHRGKTCRRRVMMVFLPVSFLLTLLWSSESFQPISTKRSHSSVRYSGITSSLSASLIEIAPYDDIIPFLSEHVQQSDQILFVGATTDLSLQMVRSGYGTKNTGVIRVIDSNKSCLDELESIALADKELAHWVTNGNLKFQHVDLTNMPDICQQSTVDAIVDYKGLDSLHSANTGPEGVLKCIDHLQDAVRLGNILVCLSKLEKKKFCSPFEERFGWVQELDGDPGEISAWYRGKTNIQATKSNFENLGLKMYVYTNTDNC